MEFDLLSNLRHVRSGESLIREPFCPQCHEVLRPSVRHHQFLSFARVLYRKSNSFKYRCR